MVVVVVVVGGVVAPPQDNDFTGLDQEKDKGRSLIGIRNALFLKFHWDKRGHDSCIERELAGFPEMLSSRDKW